MRTKSHDSPHASVARDGTGTSASFTIFSGHPLPTWLADPKSHAILEVNAAAQRAYGYTREDFLALTLDEILPGNVIALLAAPADPEKGGPRFAGEWSHRRKDGITIEVAIDAYAADLGGKVVAVVQAKDITGRVTYDRLLARLNECLQSFGPDPLENIDRLTALAGDVLEADSALYNRLEKGQLRAWGRWRALPDFDSPVPSAGHISADVIAQGAEKPFIVRHIAQSSYATSDPNVARYGLQTYIGQAVRLHGESVGALCVVYTRDFEPKPDQARFLVIIATAIGAEEVRRVLGESLRQREVIYRTMYESSPVGILSVDGTGRIVRANRAFQRIIGYTEPELTRMTFNDFTHPDDRETSNDVLVRLFDGSTRSAHLEKRYIRKNGVVLWASVTVSAIRDVNQSLLSLVSIVEDITRRKQTEESLREREEQLRLYVDHSPAAIAMFDQDMRYLVASRRWFEDYRLGDAPVIGRSHYEIFPEITDTWKEIHRRCLAGAVEKCEEDPFHRADGTIDWIRWEVLPWHRGDGSIGGIVIFSEDITERKRVEQALRESEERFRKAFMTSPDSININRLSDGMYVAINRGFADIMGYTEADVIGKTAVELRSWEDPEDRKRLVELLNARGSAKNFEARFRTKDGSLRYGLMAASVIELNGVAHIMSSTHDITERRRMEDQLRQSQKMETVGRLAGGVAHDFNNMLHVIISYVEMSLRKVAPGEAIYNYLQEVRRAAKRSAEITGQLLAFARKQTVSPKVLDLNEAVQRSQKMIRGLVGEDIEFIWLPGIDIGEVKIDPGQLDQILANLAANARDAISGVGALTIRTANTMLDEAYCSSHNAAFPGPHVLLEVSDNGRGMDRETLAHLFEPFFTTKEVGKGTGLGLATIYGIVNQNRGAVDVESAPGVGTAFRIYLPWAEGAPASAAGDDVTAAPSGGAETILLVEDEAGILTLVTQQLRDMGYTVLAAGSPEEAIHLSQAHPGRIDLLVTDVVMPQMYGRQLAERLFAMRPGLKCLYMSGYTADVITHRGMLDDGVTFIAKPFSLVALAEKVKEALAK